MAIEIECNEFKNARFRSNSKSKKAYKYSIDYIENGCYLTTILCNALGLPDDNPYLEKMRNFRKNTLQKDEKYKPLLIEYGIIGPKIATLINNEKLKDRIAKICFKKYIIPIVDLIDKDNEKAISLYLDMTKNLKDLYELTDLEISNFKIENADLSKSGHGTYKVKKITSQM